MGDGGKGSAPRKQRDEAAYAAGYDRIFGNKKVTTIYKFYADWCGPCKQLDKLLNTIEHNHNIVHVDITNNENKELIQKYTITGIPSLVRSDTGEKLTGFVSVRAIEVFLND